MRARGRPLHGGCTEPGAKPGAESGAESGTEPGAESGAEPGLSLGPSLEPSLRFKGVLYTHTCENGYHVCQSCRVPEGVTGSTPSVLPVRQAPPPPSSTGRHGYMTSCVLVVLF